MAAARNAAVVRGDHAQSRSAFAALGVDRVRITGGEPLLRSGLPALIAQLAARAGDPRPGADDQRRAARASRRQRCGGPGCTGSLSASTRCDRDRFQALTRFDEHAAVLAGIDAAAAAGFDSLKLDTVVIRGDNDDEIVRL